MVFIHRIPKNLGISTVEHLGGVEKWRVNLFWGEMSPTWCQKESENQYLKQISWSQSGWEFLLLFYACISCLQLFATPQTVAYQAPLSLGFFRQECWSGLPFSFSRGIFLTQGLNLCLLHCRWILTC